MSLIPSLTARGLTLSRLCMGLADFGSRVPEEQGLKTMDLFAEMGGSFFDTAHIYAFWAEGALGEPERILGRWIKTRGAQGVTAATKGGHSPVGSPAYPRPDDFLNPRQVEADLNESLERLGVSCIDLYYLHRDDPRVPVDELMDMLARFVESRRVKKIGASNWDPARVREANAWARDHGKPEFDVVQNQWSLPVPDWRNEGVGDVRFITEDGEKVFSEEGVILAPWSPLAGGWMAGKTSESFENEKNLARRERAKAVAEDLGVPIGSVALAWLLHRSPLVSPILGTGSEEHLLEAVKAFEVPASAVEGLR